MRRLPRWLGWGCACALALAPATAQTQGNRPPTPVQSNPLALPSEAPLQLTTPVPNLIAPAAPANYHLGANDVLAIYVFQVPEMTREVMVGGDGYIQLPFLQQAVMAAGRTASQVADEVEGELRQEGLLRAPLVQAIVRQVLSKPLVMSGALVSPQTLQASRAMSLLEAISRAGGLSENAGDWAVIAPLDGSGESRRVALGPLMEGDPQAADPMLQGNQSVRVLPAQQVVVVGSLQQPGAFYIHTGQPITVLGALALAHGVSSPADLEHAVILTPGTDHEPVSQPVNIDAILKHKSPDFALSGGSTLYVPRDGKRTLLAEVLRDAGQTAVIALGYHW